MILSKPPAISLFLNHVLTAASKHFNTILLAIMSVQVLKGTAVYQGPYPRAHYLYNYDVGFVKRGLIGSLAMYLAEGSQYRLLGIINFISYFAYFIFLVVLFRFITRNANTVTQKAVSILLVSSPLVLALGTLLGYYDALFLVLLMLSFDVCKNKIISYVACFLLVAAGLLIHELSIVFVVLPLLFQIVIHPFTPEKKKWWITGMVCFLCLLFISFTYRGNTSFKQLLSSRLNLNAHSLSTKSGETYFIKYGNYAIENNFMHDFDVHRLSMLEAFFPVYGLFIFIVSMIGIFQLVKLKRFMLAMLFAAICYLPLLIILVAWDIERFICLTCCTAFVSYMAISRFDIKLSEQILRPWIYTCMMIVSLASLLTYYPIATFYAEGETIISSNKQHILMQYPDWYIQRWFHKKPS